MGGQFNVSVPRVAISAGDDLTRWCVSEIPLPTGRRFMFPETALAVAGTTVTAFLRNDTERLLVSQSHDGGANWEIAVPGNLPAARSKTCSGVLSTGQRFLALNLAGPPVSQGHQADRDILAMAVSAPGETQFCKIVPLRNERAPLPRLKGSAKWPQWSYPSVAEAQEKIYVSYSISKEDCGVSILPLSELAI